MTNSFIGTDELAHYRNVSDATVEILETMEAGLTQIAACEPSPKNALEMKQIADATLSEVKRIALSLEPKKGTND